MENDDFEADANKLSKKHKLLLENKQKKEKLHILENLDTFYDDFVPNGCEMIKSNENYYYMKCLYEDENQNQDEYYYYSYEDYLNEDESDLIELSHDEDKSDEEARESKSKKKPKHKLNILFSKRRNHEVNDGKKTNDDSNTEFIEDLIVNNKF
jgi:hypothetical protein